MNATLNIKKNDKVVLTEPLPLRWSEKVLPVGTELIVWKAPRKGNELACSIVNSKVGGITVYPTRNQVKLVPRNCPMPKVGDFFYSSWGYEQTNIDFYQVTTVKNKMVGLRPIGATRVYDGPMSGHTKLVPNAFTGEEEFHLVKFSTEDSPYFKLTSYSSAWPCDPNTNHFFSEWH